MNILHTEASPGWGGQELRILREAEGMRSRGHSMILAVQKDGGLVIPAREKGFKVYELAFKRSRSLLLLYQLMRIIQKEKIEILNTHSSLDSWIGGLAGKLCGCHVIRTRHLSTPIRKGLNSKLLYNRLADYVVTTCEETAIAIRKQAEIPEERCRSIPTGVDPERMHCSWNQVDTFRQKLGLRPEDCLVGTLCILRGWKGISDLLQAAKLLQDMPNLKWVVVGSGVSEPLFRQEWKRLGLEKNVFFTGHITPPYVALASMDIFLLLSRGHEGVSQASLQAAWMEKPLVTTATGGLKEVCIEGETGFQVPPCDPQAIAQAVMYLAKNQEARKVMGQKARKLVESKFTFDLTLDHMQQIYQKLLPNL
jgi:glycosyltransferase involved in cell wall biosynthesis